MRRDPHLWQPGATAGSSLLTVAPMPLETVPFDSAHHLTDPVDQAEILSEAFATGDAAVIRKAVSIVARARGMTRVAADAGVTREGAYKALAPDGDPKLSTVLAILGALGVKLSATLETVPHAPTLRLG